MWSAKIEEISYTALKKIDLRKQSINQTKFHNLSPFRTEQFFGRKYQ